MVLCMSKDLAMITSRGGKYVRLQREAINDSLTTGVFRGLLRRCSGHTTRLYWARIVLPCQS